MRPYPPFLYACWGFELRAWCLLAQQVIWPLNHLLLSPALKPTSVSQLNECEDSHRSSTRSTQASKQAPLPHIHTFLLAVLQHDASPFSQADNFLVLSSISAGSRQYFSRRVMNVLVIYRSHLSDGEDPIVDGCWRSPHSSPLNLWMGSFAFPPWFECDGVGSWAWLDSENEFDPDFWEGMSKMAAVSLERVRVASMMFFKHLGLFFPIYWRLIFSLRNQLIFSLRNQLLG